MRKKLFNTIKNLLFPTVHTELRTAMSSDTIKKTVQQQIGSSLSDAPFYGRVGEGDFRLTLHGRAVDHISGQLICGVIREEEHGCTIEITFKPARSAAVSRICIPVLLILCTVSAFLGISDGGLLQSTASAIPFLVALVLFEVYLDRAFHKKVQKATVLLKELLVL